MKNEMKKRIPQWVLIGFKLQEVLMAGGFNGGRQV